MTEKETVATAPELESKEVQTEVTAGSKPEAKAEAETEVTVSEALETEQKPAETVGLDKFLEEKKGRKAAERELRELKEAQAKATTSEERQELSDDVESFLAEYPDVDPKFIKTLLGIAESKASKKAEDAIKPLTEKERAEAIDRKFKTHFDKVIESMPEYKGVVNPEVIKSLSLLPQNSKKTFSQIIEETYANATSGKRTLETTTARGGNEPENIDMARARSDEKYFDEIMSNPTLKKQYNDQMLGSIRL